MKTALVIVDMQCGLLGDATSKHDAAGLVKRLNALATKVRASGGPVIFVQHEGPSGGPFHPASPGWKLLPDLDVMPADILIRKMSCDAFLDTSLDEILTQYAIDRLIVTGCATDFCVDTTVRSALARRYATIVPSDGHTTADRPYLRAEKIIEHHNAIWADFIAPAGPALVCPAAEILFS